MYLGRVASSESSISLLLVDGHAAAEAWRTEEPNLDFAFDEATAGFADLSRGVEADVRAFASGKLTGVALNLGVGHGTMQVFRVDDRLVITESFIDDIGHIDFLTYVSGPAAGKQMPEPLVADSGFVALLVAGGSYEDLPQKLDELGSSSTISARAQIGVDCPGLVIAAGATRFRISIEPVQQGAFGDAARAVLDPIS